MGASASEPARASEARRHHFTATTHPPHSLLLQNSTHSCAALLTCGQFLQPGLTIHPLNWAGSGVGNRGAQYGARGAPAQCAGIQAAPRRRRHLLPGERRGGAGAGVGMWRGMGGAGVGVAARRRVRQL